MDRNEYLDSTYRRLENLHNDNTFKNNLFQVRARAILEEFVPEQFQIKFTFDSKKIWQYCDYLFSESILLIKENLGDKDKNVLLQYIKTAAESFEFLSKFADQGEKERLLISSAICYQISGYQANAACLSRFIEKTFIPIPDSLESGYDRNLVDRFRKSSLKFILKEINALQEISTESLDFIKSLQEEISTGIAEGNLSINDIFSLTAHGYFHTFLLDFVQYCLVGDRQLFLSAKENLSKSHKNFEKSGDVTLATIVLELRSALDQFFTRSTWFNLSEYANDLSQDRIWNIYLRNLALEKNIVEFWQSQLKAIKNNLLTSTDSFVIQMPTSAGKTFIAELAILSSLTRNPQSRCLYIAPYRALVNEIENSLSENLGSLGYQVSTLIGGFEFDAFQEFLITQSQVLIATPEKTELLFRTQPDYFNEVAVIIIDEGHILDEGLPTAEEIPNNKTLLDELSEQGNLGRGILLELLITRLKIKIPNAKFIFISAVMPQINAEDFVSWLCKNQEEAIRIEPSERPSRQVFAKFEWRSQANGELEYIGLPTLPGGRHPFVPKFIQRKQYYTGERTPKGKPQRKSFPNIDNKVQTTAVLSVRLSKTGPVLVFCSQTDHVRSVLENLIKTIKYFIASNEFLNEEFQYVENPDLTSFYEAVEWLGEEHLLTQALRYNVALHYGPLPDPVRQAVEDDFKSGKIKILVSTNTLGQGVNLPIKTVVIYSLERRWKEGDEVHTSKIKKRDFWNICGRAGRAGKETEGQIVFLKSSNIDGRLIQEYMNENNLEEVESSLYKLLLALIEKRIDQNQLIGYLDSHILSILAEEIVDTQDESSINNLLENSLVGIQSQKNHKDKLPLTLAISSVSSWIREQIPSKELRTVFASTGLNLVSCQSLNESISQFINNIESKFEHTLENPISCSAEVIESIFLGCKDLSEMRFARTVKYDSSEDEFLIVNQWINGTSINQIKEELWNTGCDESFSRYLADRLIYKLPWGINGFLHILAFRLQMEYADLPLSWQHLPAMMKFGLNNVFACWVSSLGVTSREISLQVAQQFVSENRLNLDYANFLKWFINLPNEYILNDLNSPQFQKENLIKIRNKIVIGNESLQFIRNELQALESPIRGIPYENRAIIASQVSLGDSLNLELELDNPYDPNAVRVLFRNEQIGYVQRDKAKIVSRELQLDKGYEAVASQVRFPDSSNPYPWIEINIRFMTLPINN